MSFQGYLKTKEKTGNGQTDYEWLKADKQALINRLPTVAMTKVPALTALSDDPTIPVGLLHEVCYDRKHTTSAFYAAYVLEQVATRYPERFVPVFDTFVLRLPELCNFSCQRHFTKILMLITHPKAPAVYRAAYGYIDREQLVETVFGWLIDPDTPVAVQANCMDVLLNMSDEFEWVRDELKQQIEFLLRDGSPAIQSRGKNVLQKLTRLRNGG